MDRTTQSLIEFASGALRESFTALHSTTRCDRATISRVTSGWPAVLLDADEVRALEPEEARRTYTTRQLARAERVCQLFVDSRHFTVVQKRVALVRVLAPSVTWRGVAERVNKLSDARVARARRALEVHRVTSGDEGRSFRRRRSLIQDLKSARAQNPTLSWQECRGHHDLVVAAFAYELAQAEGVALQPLTAREVATA